MTETVLVTGGTGYVGSHAIVALLERGYTVRTTVRSLDRGPVISTAVRRLTDRGALSFHVADLLADDGWAAAVDGVDRVLHVASPLGGAGGDADSLLRPARDGTVRVLAHAHAAGVRRVVMTSAAVASQPADTRRPVRTDETLWTDPDGRRLSAYQRSKVLAERAAWAFQAEQSTPTELTTVLPGAVFGPIVSTESRGSTDIIERMLAGDMPGLPDIRLEIVDVRDLADLHLRAMTAPQAAGERFLGVAGGLTSMATVAEVLRDNLGAAAAEVPTRRVPSIAVRTAALFREDMRTLASALGRQHEHDSTKARSVLGWEPRPMPETVLDCARSLLENEVRR